MNPVIIDEIGALFDGKKPVLVKRSLHDLKMLRLNVVETKIGEEVVITGTIINQANHRQPFPEMNVQLSNKDGVVLDEFKLSKKSYVRRSEIREKRYVEPNQAIQFRFTRRIKTASPEIKVEFQ